MKKVLETEILVKTPLFIPEVPENVEHSVFRRNFWKYFPVTSSMIKNMVLSGIKHSLPDVYKDITENDDILRFGPPVFPGLMYSPLGISVCNRCGRLQEPSNLICECGGRIVKYQGMMMYDEFLNDRCVPFIMPTEHYSFFRRSDRTYSDIHAIKAGTVLNMNIIFDSSYLSSDIIMKELNACGFLKGVGARRNSGFGTVSFKMIDEVKLDTKLDDIVRNMSEKTLIISGPCDFPKGLSGHWEYLETIPLKHGNDVITGIAPGSVFVPDDKYDSARYVLGGMGDFIISGVNYKKVRR